MNRVGIGNDLNPLAHALTAGKLESPSRAAVLARLQSLRQEFAVSRTSTRGVSWKVRQLYHPETLREIVFLRRSLGTRSPSDAYLRAATLGILHGHSPSFLSVRMHNTLSSSPRYVRRYLRRHRLVPERRETFGLLARRVKKSLPIHGLGRTGKAVLGDARKLTWLGGKSVDLIVNSPPYLDVVRYGKMNWLRLWFLGEKAREVDGRLYKGFNKDRYMAFLTECYSEAFRVLKDDGVMVTVVGDVRRTNLAKMICARVLPKAIEESGRKNPRLSIIVDKVPAHRKVTRIWSGKKGNATKRDRIIVASFGRRPSRRQVQWNLIEPAPL